MRNKSGRHPGHADSNRRQADHFRSMRNVVLGRRYESHTFQYQDNFDTIGKNRISVIEGWPPTPKRRSVALRR